MLAVQHGKEGVSPLREQAALVLYHYVQLSLEMEGVAVVNGQLTRALASLCNPADDSGLQNSLELLMELARQTRTSRCTQTSQP